ncbi:MAG: hypothetical protein M1281_02590 [Chloroflexi bacterium]|nr:hypothetical protein [Chloroflexota bacterium]
MANIIGVNEQKYSFPATKTFSHSSIRFDWVVILLGLWMIGGLHLDAWAHHEFEVETFFTPWHGILYSGYLALAAVLLGAFARNRLRGATWRQAMPVGYGLSLVGVAIFMAGGVGDMLWHMLFGIEVNIEALLSPTHLLLAFGGALMVTGPLRSIWARPIDISQSWIGFMPAILSLALLLAELSFFTAYAHPLSDTIVAMGHRPSTDAQVFNLQVLGISAILLQSIIMMGVILLAVRRWRLPFGGITLIITIAYGLTVSIHENFFLIPFEILAGLAAEVLYWWLKPSLKRPISFRWFAFGVPVVFYALYFLTLALTGGVWWTVHLWAGAILLAGVAGWLLSYAFVPPQIAAVKGAE